MWTFAKTVDGSNGMAAWQSSNLPSFAATIPLIYVNYIKRFATNLKSGVMYARHMKQECF